MSSHSIDLSICLLHHIKEIRVFKDVLCAGTEAQVPAAHSSET